MRLDADSARVKLRGQSLDLGVSRSDVNHVAIHAPTLPTTAQLVGQAEESYHLAVSLGVFIFNRGTMREYNMNVSTVYSFPTCLKFRIRLTQSKNPHIYKSRAFTSANLWRAALNKNIWSETTACFNHCGCYPCSNDVEATCDRAGIERFLRLCGASESSTVS